MFIDYNNLLEDDLLFNDDNDLTEAELIDYAEYLYDNNISPGETEFPQKLEYIIQGDENRRQKIIDMLNDILKDFKWREIDTKGKNVSEELRKIIDTISAQSHISLMEATTEEKIVAFEEKHDIKLPSQYREWILFSDGGEIASPDGIQLYGVEHKPTIDVKNDKLPDDSYVVIGALASGDPIVLKKTEDKIFIYNLEGNRIEEDEIYEDFYAFLNDMPNILERVSFSLTSKELLDY